MQALNPEDQVSDVLVDVQLPLENVEYTIQQFLLSHGTRLDVETRSLLAGVRDCVGRVAGSTREVVDRRRGRSLPT